MSKLTRAQESRAAIEKLYIEMRHLFNRGHYKPFGSSGQELCNALKSLQPEIYGSMNDPEKVELDGLVYVMDRLPKGIEECRYVRLISEEGYHTSGFERISPAKRRRNCYRVDQDQMLIEITRGRSEIYDLLTHLTFMYIEAEKIKINALKGNGEKSAQWRKLEDIIENGELAGESFSALSEEDRDAAFSYLSILLGRTFEETKRTYQRLNANKDENKGIFNIVYWLGKIAMEREFKKRPREISFTPTLRERIGQHLYGERWAANIKKHLVAHNLAERPLHIVSANLHSVLNCLFANVALTKQHRKSDIYETAVMLSKPENQDLMEHVAVYAARHGMVQLDAKSGTHISVQLFDTAKLDLDSLPPEIGFDRTYIETEKPVIIVMDYAFGEQAYETMDELLRPLELQGKRVSMPVASINIMGKAGILMGNKGDLMIPTAHVFEGTADNYPFENACKPADFEGSGLQVFKGTMVTVLGTSLQNRDVLKYFKDSSWDAVGLEMEGAHYQKAIQAASAIRHNISRDVVLRYAYYASDNPLITGATLASGSLGEVGVRPTYLITANFLNGILTGNGGAAKNQ